jgi:cytochrome c biogenesis protein
MAQLASFEQKQASVFQVARAPGKTLVYLGSVLLIIGVFAMLYVRERRLWIWIQDDGTGGTKLSAALSTTRKTLDADQEFENLKAALLATPSAPTDAKPATPAASH